VGHQCTRCGEIYPDAAPELLSGCKCGAKFFYYIRQDRLDELNRINNEGISDTLKELDKADKTQIEKDIREITGLENEPDKPVVLDLESVRVLSPGKFEIDIVNLFSKKRPVIYKLEEGKYIIDLTSTYKISSDEINKKIRNPEVMMNERVNEKKKEKPSSVSLETEGHNKEKAIIETKEEKDVDDDNEDINEGEDIEDNKDDEDNEETEN
jgi:uncharacterized protein